MQCNEADVHCMLACLLPSLTFLMSSGLGYPPRHCSTRVALRRVWSITLQDRRAHSTRSHGQAHTQHIVTSSIAKPMHKHSWFQPCTSSPLCMCGLQAFYGRRVAWFICTYGGWLPRCSMTRMVCAGQARLQHEALTRVLPGTHAEKTENVWSLYVPHLSASDSSCGLSGGLENLMRMFCAVLLSSRRAPWGASVCTEHESMKPKANVASCQHMCTLHI